MSNKVNHVIVRPTQYVGQTLFIPEPVFFEKMGLYAGLVVSSKIRYT